MISIKVLILGLLALFTASVLSWNYGYDTGYKTQIADKVLRNPTIRVYRNGKLLEV